MLFVHAKIPMDLSCGSDQLLLFVFKIKIILIIKANGW